MCLSTLKLIRKKITMLKKIVFMPVDVKPYAEAVAKYNATTMEEREDWQDYKFPADETVLCDSYAQNGDVIEEYILEVLPEWLDSTDSLDGGTGELDAEDYYGMSNLPDDDHLFKQDQKLVVVRHNYPDNEEKTMSYDDFIDEMKEILPFSITDPGEVDSILSGSKSEK